MMDLDNVFQYSILLPSLPLLQPWCLWVHCAVREPSKTLTHAIMHAPDLIKYCKREEGKKLPLHIDVCACVWFCSVSHCRNTLICPDSFKDSSAPISVLRGPTVEGAYSADHPLPYYKAESFISMYWMHRLHASMLALLICNQCIHLLR